MNGETENNMKTVVKLAWPSKKKCWLIKFRGLFLVFILMEYASKEHTFRNFLMNFFDVVSDCISNRHRLVESFKFNTDNRNFVMG